MGREFLFDFLERFLAEVADFHHFLLGLLGEFQHGGDTRPLEAVVGTDAEVEFLDEHVLELVVLGADLLFGEGLLRRFPVERPL